MNKWEDDIRRNFRERECKVVDWRTLTQESVECWVVANSVSRFWVSSVTKSVLKSLVSALSTITQLKEREVEKDWNIFLNLFLRSMQSVRRHSTIVVTGIVNDM
jgi:hypothetical protein